MILETLLIIVIVTQIAAVVALVRETRQKTRYRAERNFAQDSAKSLQEDLLNIQDELGKEREKNKTLLSQKKSSETRLGQISEHLVPFLNNFRHNPKDLHFIGQPIDYMVFDFDQGAITFLEIKSGNSRATKRQKTVKNIIKEGRVYYEEIRINEKGLKASKREGPKE